MHIIKNKLFFPHLALALSLLLTTLGVVLLPVNQTRQVALAADTTDVQSKDVNQLEPHLGYGIHIAPHGPFDIRLLDQLGMEWVKLYSEEQIPIFQDKLILYRLDLGYPSNWQAFRADMRRIGQRMAERGVMAIEIHNEPNLAIEWPGGINPVEYTQMLQAAYEEIKAVAPQIIVVSAGLAPTITTPDGRAMTDLDFARVMFENGAGNYFDAFGYHPYGFAYPPEQAPAYNRLNFRRAELMRQLMVEYGLASKPMWMTEFGWLRDPAEEGVACSDGHPAFRGFGWLRVDGRTQAEYIVRSFDYADKNWPWAGPMFLWNLNWSRMAPESLPQCSHMRWFSLLRPQGGTTVAFAAVADMPRRPAYFAPGQIPEILLPELTLVAYDDMTVAVGESCPATIRVGEFMVKNTGSAGSTFTATITPATGPHSPEITVSPEVAEADETVTIYADTTGLPAGQYVVFINVTTEIDGKRANRYIQAYILVTESFSDC
jgi:hypothetical protein